MQSGKRSSESCTSPSPSDWLLLLSRFSLEALLVKYNKYKTQIQQRQIKIYKNTKKLIHKYKVEKNPRKVVRHPHPVTGCCCWQDFHSKHCVSHTADGARCDSATSAIFVKIWSQSSQLNTSSIFWRARHKLTLHTDQRLIHTLSEEMSRKTDRQMSRREGRQASYSPTTTSLPLFNGETGSVQN